MNLEEIGFYTLCEERAKKIPDGTINRCEIIITDRCNFKCPYCRGLEDKLHGDISLDSIKYILDIFDDKIRNIRFSGGEPTLNKDLLEMIKYATQNKIGRIAISTNGSNDQQLYFDLVSAGANDFSVSLDSCCSSTGDTMTGKTGQWKKVIDMIEFLSSISYTTVGVVLIEQNISELENIIRLAHDLYVNDIRIIPAAQTGTRFPAFYIDSSILDKHPILKYRYDNIMNNIPVRGLRPSDYNRCPLVLDDIAIAGGYHYPCIIYMREKGEPIGNILYHGSEYSSITRDKIMAERYNWYKNHDVYKDPICHNNCLDVCRDYNNKFYEYHGML